MVISTIRQNTKRSMKTNHNIYIGDARIVLKVLPHSCLDFSKESVALLVTSPPYFVGRTYEQYLSDEDDYFAMLSEVFTYAAEFIEPHGKVAINFADRYANKKLTGKVQEIAYIPFYNALMESLGFTLWTRIIWRKEYTIGEDCKHVLSPPNKYGHMRVSPNWEYVFVWKKDSADQLPKKDVDMTHEEWAEWVDGIWVIPSVKRNYRIEGKKVAMFPPELPRRLIKMYTEPGDIVLDPFVGTGTTLREALLLGRNSIGIELDVDNIPFIKETLDVQDEYIYEGDLFGNEFDVEFITL